MKYEFRKRANYRVNDKHIDWQKCTEKQKQQIEQSAGAKFEFREVKKPKPTPSMDGEKETNTKKD